MVDLTLADSCTNVWIYVAIFSHEESKKATTNLYEVSKPLQRLN